MYRNETGITMQTGEQFTEQFKITSFVYEGFIQLFNDRNTLHTNDAFAQKQGFSDKVMHGNILNGFLSYFVGECLPLKNVIIHTQQIQFKHPVFLDDELQLDAEVSGVFDSVNAVEMKFKFTNTEKKIVAKGKLQIGILT